MDRTVFLKLNLVGRDINKQVQYNLGVLSGKAQKLWKLREGSQSLEEWRRNVVSFQEETTSKLRFQEQVEVCQRPSESSCNWVRFQLVSGPFFCLAFLFLFLFFLRILQFYFNRTNEVSV